MNAAVPSPPEHPAAARLRLLEAEAEHAPAATAFDLAVQQAAAALGGIGALIHLVDSEPDELRLTASCGLGPNSLETWTKLPSNGLAAPARAVRSGKRVWRDDGMGTPAAGTATVPLPGPQGPVGALTVITLGRIEPDRERWLFLEAVAVWAAAHTINAPAAGSADRRRQPASTAELRMNELTVALAEAVTSQDVVRAVQERVLPPFGADGMLVEVIERDRLHILGSTGYSQAFLHAIEGVPLTTHTAATTVLHARSPRFAESADEFLHHFPQLEELVHASGKHAWAVLPLIASGRPIGCCVVSFAHERHFDHEQRALLTALSGLVAQALERARLYDAEHARAQNLQRGLLPRSLPALPAITADARYLPAGQGDEVGGDWYDVITLSGDRVALVAGDVMGHGIAEAATMGRVRTAVRTLADLDLPPDELLAHLSDLVRGFGDDWYATCLYAEYDPVTRLLTFCTAGHPLPLIFQPDGTVRRPEVDADPPLGAAEPPFRTHELHLPDEALLVLCTDGLVESASRDIDEGLQLLENAVSHALAERNYFRARKEPRPLALGQICDDVMAELLPDRERTGDDAVLLLAHTHSTPADDVALFMLPDDPRASGQARRHVREQLAQWDLAELEMATELLVSELVGNVTRHAPGPCRLRLLRSRTLICEVYDGSPTTPRIRRAAQTDEGGRGLQLVAALSRRWGTRFLAEGKCIWAEQEIPVL
ncbi:ATP-binding SpoIIE family protein phosphatase [Streptomyces hydrogenans]